MATAARLPAVEVVAAPRPLPAALPRLDIAVFAGFAERGPCHVPVRIGSLSDFVSTFGGHLPLALNPATGTVAEAGLAPGVAAFFAGGGRECHVIRLARTAESDARWQAVAGRPPQPADQAEAGCFPLAALLAGAPAERFAPQLVASSVGSWSDRLLLHARVSAFPAGAAGWDPLPGGVRLRAPAGVAAGDLVAFTEPGGEVRHLVAVRADGADLLLVHAGSHVPADPGSAGLPRPVEVRRAPGADPEPATLAAAAGAFRLETPGAAAIHPGDWLSVTASGLDLLLLVQGSGGSAVTGRGFSARPPLLPDPGATLAVLRLDLEIEEGQRRTRLAGLGLTPLAPASLWGLAGQPLAFDPRPSGLDGLAARFGADALSPRERALLGTAILPLGLSDRFEVQPSVRHSGRPPLARDGLSALDETIFLDPALASLEAIAVARSARQLAHVEGVALLGLHAAAPLLDGSADAPALLAVPDCAQGPFMPAPGLGPAPTIPPAPAPPDWEGPFGACAPPPATPPLAGPSGPVANRPFRLAWPLQPAGVTLRLEEAGDPGFAGAIALGGLEPDGVTLAARPPGHHFFRLRAEQGGLASGWSTLAVTVAQAGHVVASGGPARAAAAAVRQRVRVGLVRLAAGTGEALALLSFPPDADAAAEAADFARLAPGAGSIDRLGAPEGAALSHALAIHPWLRPLTGEGGGMPPEGAVAAAIAARAARPFVSPANARLAAAGRIPPLVRPGEAEALLAAAVAPVWPTPSGPILLDQPLLSLGTGHPVSEVSTRLLLIRLRRALLAAGQPLVFEPLSDATRRGLERALDAVLARFARAGALGRAGARVPYRLVVTDHPGDRDSGRLVAELSIAPAAPVRALALTLELRPGALALAEAAA